MIWAMLGVFGLFTVAVLGLIAREYREKARVAAMLEERK